MATLQQRWRMWRRRVRHAIRDIQAFTHPAVKIVIVGMLAALTLALVAYAVTVK